jgi:NADH-quinone oxidoreductase subunit K
MPGVPLQHVLVVGLALFVLGLYTVLTRRNAIGILMGIELLLNAANVNYVAFARYSGTPTDGQIFAIFVIMLAAAEAAIGLAIVLGIYQTFETIDVDATRLRHERDRPTAPLRWILCCRLGALGNRLAGAAIQRRFSRRAVAARAGAGRGGVRGRGGFFVQLLARPERACSSTSSGAGSRSGRYASTWFVADPLSTTLCSS